MPIEYIPPQSGGGGMVIGDVITGGTNTYNLYVGAGGALAQDAAFTRTAAGQYLLYDATGPNQLTVRAGVSQSTTPAIRVRNSGDSADVFSVSGAGAITAGPATFRSSGDVLQLLNGSGTLVAKVNTYGDFISGAFMAESSGVAKVGGFTSGLLLASDVQLRFSSTTSAIGSTDVALRRGIAGLIDIDSGVSGQYRDLRLRALYLNGSSSSTPMLDNSGTTLRVRLGDGSGDAPFSAAGATFSGDVSGASTSAFYWGASSTDGSWRMVRSGNNLEVQRRESGVWVKKGEFLP